MVALLILIVGLVLLIGGAKLLVDGVSSLAVAAGVSPVVVGLTVVAFGTSTPEVVINGISAWKGETALAFGNVVGSCAINIGFVLALTALVRPLSVEKSLVTREIPLLLLAVAALAVLSGDRLLNRAESDVLVRGDGLILLLIFGVFVYSTVRQAIDVKPRDPFIADVREEVSEKPAPVERRIGRDAALTLAGLAGVALGGRMAVLGAVRIAESLGVPEVVVGLTIVSFGTTLPELATCITAARRGHSDLAIGNIVGSNLYNTLFIGGMVAAINPVAIPEGGWLDLAVAATLSLLLVPVAIGRNFRITRGEGALLLAVYLGYLTLRLASS